LVVNAILRLRSRPVDNDPNAKPPPEVKKSQSLQLPDKKPPVPKEHYLMTKLQLIEGDFPYEIPGLETVTLPETDKETFKVKFSS
jgi:hypothetical protein